MAQGLTNLWGTVPTVVEMQSEGGAAGTLHGALQTGALATTPWTANSEGRGPAWSNSLFEDNAEFALGFGLAADMHLALARRLSGELRSELGAELVDAILDAPQRRESELRAQRVRVRELEQRLSQLTSPAARQLASVADRKDGQAPNTV